MGKVNLRNRIRDNSGNDSNYPKNSDDLLEQLNGSDSGTAIPEKAHVETIKEIAEPAPVSSRLKRSVETVEQPVEKEIPPLLNSRLNRFVEETKAPKEINPRLGQLPKPEIKETVDEKPFIQEPVFTQPKHTESGIFKDEALPEGEKKFKGLFGKGTKLFNKKDDPNNGIAKVEQGLLDRLNVNKKMLYTAIGFATAASFLVITYINSYTETSLFGSEMVPVLVANKDIPEKSVITMADLASKPIPKKFVLPSSIILDGKTDPKSFVGKIALTDLYENEQLTAKRVAAQEDSPWLSPVVPVNTRAFTIPSKSMSYIKPKDHVDVIVSMSDPSDKSRLINTPVLQNAIVLAVDGRYKVSSAEPSTSGETVTVAVPNKMVNFFTLLQDRGNFQLVLRRDGDTTNLDTKYTINQLEVMLNSSGVKVDRVEHFEMPKPVIIHREVAKPVYVAPPPVYNPPPPVYYPPPKPVYVAPRPKYVAKPVVKPKPQPVVKPKEVPVMTNTTVTVINGTSVSQHNVSKEKAK